jgi:uncharacterized protein YneF (UPF0154 family)
MGKVVLEAIILFFLLGFALGYFLAPKHTDEWIEIYDKLKEEKRNHIKEIQYYKQLCNKLAEENNKLRNPE